MGKFNDALDSLATNELRLSGTCMKARVLPRTHIFPIFVKPDPKAKMLGELIATYQPDFMDGNIDFNFIDVNGKKSKFSPNLYAGYCESMDNKQLYIHEVTSEIHGWSNLGEGPWGKEGWLNVKARPILDSNLRFKFDDTYFEVGFSKMLDGRIKMLPIGIDDDNEKVMDLRDIISPNGRIKFPVTCDVRC